MITQYFRARLIRVILLATVLAGGFLLNLPVDADERPLYQDISSDENKIHITSDQLEILTASGNDNMAEFKGHVRAIRGDMVITCERLKLFFKQGAMVGNAASPGSNSIERILAKTNVKIKMDDRLAFAEEAEYLLSSGDITLKGDPVKVSAGNTYITGHRITMAADGKITVLPGKGGQVEAMVFPESESPDQ